MKHAKQMQSFCSPLQVTETMICPPFQVTETMIEHYGTIFEAPRKSSALLRTPTSAPYLSLGPGAKSVHFDANQRPKEQESYTLRGAEDWKRPHKARIMRILTNTIFAHPRIQPPEKHPFGPISRTIFWQWASGRPCPPFPMAPLTLPYEMPCLLTLVFTKSTVCIPTSPDPIGRRPFHICISSWKHFTEPAWAG